MNLESRLKLSPIFEYWNSDQSEKDEKERLQMVDYKQDFQNTINLFIEEPYKWEILYQSVLNEAIDIDLKRNQYTNERLLRTIMKLLIVFKPSIRKKQFQILSQSNLLPFEFLVNLRSFSSTDIEILESRKRVTFNPIKLMSVLISIFTNPYCIEIKRAKIRPYEKSGYVFCKINYTLKRLVNNHFKSKKS